MHLFDFRNHLFNPSVSKHLSTNVTLHFLLEISHAFTKINKGILVESIVGEVLVMQTHSKKQTTLHLQ